MLGKLLAPLACVSLIASPALAQSAQSLSVQPALVERAGGAEDGSQLAGSWLPPVLFGAIVIAGILTATGVIFDDDDEPASP